METLNKEMTANERYIFLDTEVKNQMKILKQKLITHNRKQRSNINNYGFVGDLGYIITHLKELNSFLK